MNKPHELLQAIQNGELVSWEKVRKVFAREQIKPSRLMTVFQPDSLYDTKTRVQIIDQEEFLRLKNLFPAPVDIVDRPTASIAGNSHARAVTGSMLTLDKPSWPEPKVAICRDGLHWSVQPEAGEHLLLVENLENFIRSKETLALAIERCEMSASFDRITLGFGSGNAASKACNALFYRNFVSVNCLFDVDLGGIQIYQNIKKSLVDSGTPVRFLVPDTIDVLLEQSRRKLPNSERQKLKAVFEEYPELRPLIASMYQSHRKLEQETYLD